MHDLVVITTHYNPCGYQKIRTNYKNFRQKLRKDVPVYTFEASFDGDFYANPTIATIATEKHFLWQKERMLNVLLDYVADKTKAVAWIDADISFDNQYWVEDCLRQLKKTPVVQLFSVYENEGTLWPSITSKDSSTGAKRMLPGGAWAATTEVLQDCGGFMDTAITGSGDLLMYAAWAGEFDAWMIANKMSPAWRKQFARDAYPYYDTVRGRLGCVHGTIHHMPHGSFSNRNYCDRNTMMHELGFDPERDIEIDPQTKLWQWKDTAHPQIVTGIKEYFFKRKEDD